MTPKTEVQPWESGGVLRKQEAFYVLGCCSAGFWQAWCFNYGPAFTIAVVGLPFALASFLYLSNKRSGWMWRPLLLLWVGMPIGVSAAALTILAETGVMWLFGFGMDNLPFDTARLLIGEGVACLVWAKCLQASCRYPESKNVPRVFHVFAILCLGVVLAYGLSLALQKATHKDFYLLVTSVTLTLLSSLIVIHGKQKQRTAQVPRKA